MINNTLHPYIWVQKICGLGFASLDPKSHQVCSREPVDVVNIKETIVTRASSEYES